MPQGCRKTDALRRWLFGFSGSPMAPWGGGSVVGSSGPGCPGPWLLGCHDHADRRDRLLGSEPCSGSLLPLRKAHGSGCLVAGGDTVHGVGAEAPGGRSCGSSEVHQVRGCRTDG